MALNLSSQLTSIALASITALGLAFLCSPASAESVTTCEASDYTNLQNCLAKTARPLLINLTHDIVLGVGQRIQLDGLDNVTLQGAGGAHYDQLVTISETVERMRLADPSPNGAGNKAYLVIGGNARNITISNLAFADAPESMIFLRARCRTGANPDPKRSNLWDVQYCYAPVLLGSVRANSNEASQMIRLERITIDTNKAILMDIRRTTGLSIRDSSFGGVVRGGGTVYGVLMHPKFHHLNTIFAGNRFKYAGTAALSVFNTTNTVIERNAFVDNHIDPQYQVPNSSPPQYFPGGQLYIADDFGAPNNGVRITDNEISMTPEYSGHHPGKGTTYGLEIMNGEKAPISDVLIEGNHIHDLSSGGISVHNSARLGQAGIVIRHNFLNDNYRDYAPGRLSLPAYIQTETDPAVFPNHQHENVDMDSNQFSRGGIPPLSASFLDTPKHCVLASANQSCSITFRWAIAGMLPGSAPIIRADGKPVKAFGPATSGSVVIPWVTTRNHVFTLHLNPSDIYPLAMINIVAIPSR